MSTSFSAAPQALGYLYQARVALFLLLQCPDEAIVKVEALDDIELTDPLATAKLRLTQLKHHVSKKAELTDHSSDLWKSIRVWAEQVSDKLFTLQDTRLYLVTTATASPSSVVSKLSIRDRDPSVAEARLLDVAKTSGNKALKPSFDAFLALTVAQRRSLVASITVLDNHADIGEYKTKIRQHIRPAVRQQHVSALYERLEGWWFDRIVQHLLHSATTPFISAFEVNEKIASLAEGFHLESLPIDFLHEEPDDEYVIESEQKIFVRQLKAIHVSSRAVGKAILDYYRAFEQRARWIDEGLLTPGELTDYEATLIDEWERYFDSVCGLLPETATNEELISHGLKILRWAELEALHLKIRPRVDADFIRRGSFHMLADRAPTPSVHWHPKFVETMISAVVLAATP